MGIALAPDVSIKPMRHGTEAGEHLNQRDMSGGDIFACYEYYAALPMCFEAPARLMVCRISSSEDRIMNYVHLCSLFSFFKLQLLF